MGLMLANLIVFNVIDAEIQQVSLYHFQEQAKLHFWGEVTACLMMSCSDIAMLFILNRFGSKYLDF